MLSNREIDRIVNLNLDALGLEIGDKIMLGSAIRQLSQALTARSEKTFAEAYKNFENWVNLCDKKLEITALLGNGEHIPDDVYDNFITTGSIDTKHFSIIANSIFNKRPLKPREQMIYNARKAEIDDLVARSSQTTTATKTTQTPPPQAPSKNIKTGRIDYAKVDRSAFLRQAKEAENNDLPAYEAISVMGSGDKKCSGNCASVLLIGSGDIVVKGVVYGDIKSIGRGDIKAGALKGGTATIQGSSDIKVDHMLAGSRVSIQGNGDFIGKNNYDTLIVNIQGDGDAMIKNNYGKIVLKQLSDGDFYLGDELLEPGVIFTGQQVYEENDTIYIEYVGPGNESNSLQPKKKTGSNTSAFVSGSRNVIIGSVDGHGDLVLGDTIISKFDIDGNSFRIQNFNTSGVAMVNGNVSFDGKSLDHYIKNGKSTFFGTLEEICNRVGINNKIQQNDAVVCDYVGDNFKAFKLTKHGLSTIVVIYNSGQILYAGQ